jgi:nucleoside-diphosphate-sugar epimerase
MTHVILGSGGAIGTPFLEVLRSHGKKVVAVSRTGRTTGAGAAEGSRGSDGVVAVKADLANEAEVAAAIPEGATAYLMVGLPYDARVWKVQWPKIMRGVVKACEAKGARLLFFDNVYMYGRVEEPMTEETPVRPSSEKGQIRAEIAQHLLEEIRARRITALIARAADFYGPHAAASSVPYVLSLQPLIQGRKPRWLINAKTRHSLSYTVDCARGLELLAEASDSFGQIWHLPTAHPALTGEDFIRTAAEKLGRAPGYSVVPRLMLSAAGLFNRQLLEVSRMGYQNEQDYIFDSAKFEKRFAFTPTPYAQGIEETLKFFGGTART